MKSLIIFSITLLFGPFITQSAPSPAVPAPQAILTVEEFALGGVGFGGQSSDGEIVFEQIISRNDNLEQFLQIYAKGNNQSKMYSMVAFYYLDRDLYEHIKANHINRDPAPTLMWAQGCSWETVPCQYIFTRIEDGAYERFIPEELRPPSSNENESDSATSPNSTETESSGMG